MSPCLQVHEVPVRAGQEADDPERTAKDLWETSERTGWWGMPQNFASPRGLTGAFSSKRFECWALATFGKNIIQMMCDPMEKRGIVPRSGCGFTKNHPSHSHLYLWGYWSAGQRDWDASDFHDMGEQGGGKHRLQNVEVGIFSGFNPRTRRVGPAQCEQSQSFVFGFLLLNIWPLLQVKKEMHIVQ